jgi:hypothetical protein
MNTTEITYGWPFQNFLNFSKRTQNQCLAQLVAEHQNRAIFVHSQPAYFTRTPKTTFRQCDPSRGVPCGCRSKLKHRTIALVPSSFAATASGDCYVSQLLLQFMFVSYQTYRVLTRDSICSSNLLASYKMYRFTAVKINNNEFYIYIRS